MGVGRCSNSPLASQTASGGYGQLERTQSGACAVSTSNSGREAMWIAFGAIFLMVAILVIFLLVWMWTGLLVALIVLVVLLSVGASAATALQRRRRGL